MSFGIHCIWAVPVDELKILNFDLSLCIARLVVMFVNKILAECQWDKSLKENMLQYCNIVYMFVSIVIVLLNN